MSKVEKQILKALRGFVRKLKSGKPIIATQLTREQTPDGPLTTRKKVKLLP